QSVSNGHHYSGGILLLGSFILSAPLGLRTRLPLTAWVTSAGAILFTQISFPPHTLSTGPYLFTEVLVYALCLYCVSLAFKGWAVGGGATAAVGAALRAPQTAVAAVFLTAIPVIAGVVVRSRRSDREQLEVAERRHKGERAVLEERQRIARELHDVVAHHMSV